MRWTSNLPHFGILYLVIVLALCWAGRQRYFEVPVTDDGDAAANAMQIENAKRFSELHGNYSRFEFNHPGPAFFYVYAAGEYVFHDWYRIAPSPKGAHLLTSMLLQAGFFTLGLAILQSHLRLPAWPAIAALSAAVYLGPLHSPFTSVWPPHVILMPFFCFLAAAISTALGRIRHLIPLSLSGGFLVHGHVAQALFVGGLGGLALVLGATTVRRETGLSWRALVANHRGVVMTCGGLILLFATPLVLDVLLHGRRGNVAGILGFYYVHLSERISLLRSVLYFVSFATHTSEQHAILTPVGAHTIQFFREHALTIAASAAMFFVAPAVAFVLRRKNRPAEARFYAAAAIFTWAAAFLGIFWARSQIGGIENFNGYFIYSLYSFALVVAIAPLVALLPGTLGSAARVASCAAAAIAFAGYFRESEIGEWERGAAIKAAIFDGLSRDSSALPRFLVFEHASWPTVIGLGLELQRAGVDFYVAPWWGFMFGKKHEEQTLTGEYRPQAGSYESATDERARVWWITRPGEGGIRLSSELSLFTDPAPIRPDGDEIDFTPGKNGFRHVVSGITVGNISYAVTDLPRVLLLLAPRPATTDVEIRIDAADPTKSMPAEIHFNGVSLGRVQALERGEVRVVVPKDLWNSKPTARLEIRFPEIRRPTRRIERPRYERWPGWWLWGIKFGAKS